MSYNVLPKTHTNIKLQITLQNKTITPDISSSYFNFLNDKQLILQNIKDKTEEHTFDNCYKLLNIKNYINTHNIKVEDDATSKSLFFNLIEIFNNYNANIIFKKCNKFLHIGEKYKESISAVEHLQKNSKEVTVYESIDKVDNTELLTKDYFDYFFIELKSDNLNDPNKYILNQIKTIVLIINKLNLGSLLIIKLDYLFYQPVLEFVYVITSMFEKTLLVKPVTSDTVSLEKYLVCKNLKNNSFDISSYLDSILNNTFESQNISSIINNKVPIYFKNKLTEIDVILGQNLLENIQELINFLNYKNKIEKVDNIEKSNIHKASIWLIKNKLSHNTFL